jgi:NADPH-dependent 2,4-dienoyl-CoA reductase/sulfur reductase-like enzyme
VDFNKKKAVVIESETGSSLGLQYDFLVAATGLRRVWPVVPQAKSREAYLSEAAEHIEAVRKAKDGVVVIGGGKKFLACPET